MEQLEKDLEEKRKTIFYSCLEVTNACLCNSGFV